MRIYQLALSLSLFFSTAALSAAEIESNNTPASANTLTSNVTMSGNLYDGTDEDYFRINAGPSGTLTINVRGYNNADLQVLNPSLEVVSAINVISGTEELSVGVGSQGYYEVSVFDCKEIVGAEGGSPEIVTVNVYGSLSGKLPIWLILK